ncbi:MAG TPA: hypothetical protein VNB65_05705 [Gaiellaceae bacterium]|jgi:hypothetical protein|nr:hypothetical protein [Gaiellaceae bacterium]
MRSNRRRNWLIKRIALGFAVAAFAAPVAQASVDEGSSPQAKGYQAFVTDFPSYSTVNASDYGMPRALPSDYVQARGDQIELVRAQHRVTGSDIVAADYGMPRALPNDYALSSGNQIEVVRAQPRGTSNDKIEFVRTQPRSVGEPQVIAAGFDWNDAAIGAGLVLGLVLLGGGAALATRHTGRAQTA